MLSATETEVIRRFSERVCHLDAEGAESAESRADRVCVKVGQKLSRSTQPMEAIAVPTSGDPGPLAEAIAQQVETLTEDGARRFYLTAYRKGSTAPCHQQRLDTERDSEDHEDTGPDAPPSSLDWNSPGAFSAAAAHALHANSRLLMGLVRDQQATLLHLAERTSELGTRVVVAELVGGANASAAQAAAMKDAIDAAAPVLAAVAPVVAAAGIDWLKARADRERADAAATRGEDGPPADPAERTAYHLARLDTEAAAALAHIGANPDALTDPQLDKLERDVAGLGMALAMLKGQRQARAAA